MGCRPGGRPGTAGGRRGVRSGLGAGAGELVAAGGAGRDPDAAQQVQGRLGDGGGSGRVRVHPRDLLKGSWCARPGRVSIRPGLTAAGALERRVVVELAAPWPCRWRRAGAWRWPSAARGATSSASTSTTERLSPSGVSQLRDLSRPMTTARSPLDSDSVTCSASCRQTLTRKKLVSPSRQLSPSLTRAVTARRKLATGLPLGVCLSSGSSVRLPVMVTWVSAMAALLGARGVLAGRSRWWSGRVPAPPSCW